MTAKTPPRVGSQQSHPYEGCFSGWSAASAAPADYLKDSFRIGTAGIERSSPFPPEALPNRIEMG
jgi:hypothetical protein